MIDIIESGAYALVFLALALLILVAGWFALDFMTPGHRMGAKLVGTERTDVRQGVSLTTETGSHSAGLVAGTWMVAQAAVIFTAIWTNAHGTDFGAALGWTVAFSLIGLFFQCVAFMALDAVTPGNLGDEVCAPGPVTPLARLAAANVAAVALVVIASIA